MALEPEPREKSETNERIRYVMMLAGLILVGGIVWGYLASYGFLPGNPGQIIGLSMLVVALLVCCSAALITGTIAQKIPEYGEMEEKFRQAMDHYDMGEWEDALKIFKELMGPQMDHKRALYYAARCCEKLDQWEMVKTYIKRYIQMQPRDREAWDLLAEAHKRLFEYEEAEEAKRQAEQLPSRGK